MKKRNILLSFLVFAMTILSVQAQNAYFVDAGVATSGDGETWGAAFKTLEEAIGAVAASDVVFVKKGTYTAPSTDGLGYFFDSKNVTLYGNCEGTESLSGLPVIDENTVIGTILKAPDDGAGNYLGRVATLFKGSVTMIGFDFEGGDGTKTVTTAYGQQKYAGGVYIQGKGTLKYCKIHGATAPSGGGVQLVLQSADEVPVLEYCEIYDNTASSTASNTGGGGIHINGNAIVKNCIIRDNEANYFGGAMYVYAGDDVLISNCVIKNNTAPRTGGVYFSKNGAMVNCLVLENTASLQAGGGISLGNGTLLLNSTVVNNKVTPNTHAGGVIINNGLVKNCIIWGNTINNGAVEADIRLAATSTVTNSCYKVSNGSAENTATLTLVNNIKTDPLFVSAATGDFTLTNTTGTTSPCIDTGDNTAYDIALYPLVDLNNSE